MPCISGAVIVVDPEDGVCPVLLLVVIPWEVGVVVAHVAMHSHTLFDLIPPLPTSGSVIVSARANVCVYVCVRPQTIDTCDTRPSNTIFVTSHNF